jgi:hypothetical protein
VFHLTLYSLTPPGAPFTLVDVPAVEDSVLTITAAQHPIFEVNIDLINWYAFGSTDITRVIAENPKTRVIQSPSLRPFDAAAVPSSRNFFPDYRRHPLHLDKIDEQAMKMSGSAGTGAAYVVAAWFGDGNYSSAQGDVLTVHGVTANLTTPAGKWASAIFGIDTPLPAGRYKCIGLEAYATGLAFARLIFPGQRPLPWRPGVVCGQDPTFQGGYCFRFGAMGDYGEFSSFAQPQIEVWSVAGLAAVPVNLFMDLIRVG